MCSSRVVAAMARTARRGRSAGSSSTGAEAVVASYNLVFEHQAEIQVMAEKALMWEALCAAAERGEDLSGLLQDARHMGAGALELHFAELVGNSVSAAA